MQSAEDAKGVGKVWEEGSETFINFSSWSSEFCSLWRTFWQILCFQVRQNVTDKNYGLGLAYVSVNDAEPVACCTKIIIIQYSQAVIENLVIYSAPYIATS